MLIDLVGSALVSMDGVAFTELDACPSCGGSLTGHDLRKKRFAVVMEGGKPRVIHVHVKRFYCNRCKNLCYAEAPFYPETRLGSPVVDLCALLAARMPFHRVARLLAAMGVIVDRGTIRNYAARDFGRIPYTEPLRRHAPYVALKPLPLCRRKQASFHPGGRSARCLWFQSRRPGSASRQEASRRAGSAE